MDDRNHYLLNGGDLASLKAWHQSYVAADDVRTSLESEVIQAVTVDRLNHVRIEENVQRLTSAADVADGFCAKCRHLFNHWPELTDRKSWDYAVGRAFHTHEIEAATRAGCKLCTFLLTRLRADKLLDVFRKIEARLHILGDGGTTSLSIENWGSLDNKSQLLWLNWPGKTTDHCNNDGALVGFESHFLKPEHKMWQTKGDPLDMARAWICECRDTHKQCHNLKDYDLPTRLVSIGESAVKLVATTTLDIVPSYATLSYCWGAEDFTMLTSDTLQSFLAEIPTQELPKTFQDAIEIARELGLAYIWIDALCIIQREEGSHDWHQEAGRMVSVYGGASINIAASSSSDARGGCFTKSEYFSGGFVTKVRTGTGERVQNFHSQTVYAESTTETYLARRAWTLQEKLLAPRTLYVGDHGLFWECRSTIKSEFHPDGFEDILGSHLVVPEDQPWDWTEIVRLYSAANLTFASDRLPALSGIAKRQQAATSNTYIAGMWRQKLVEELTWGLQNPRKRQHRPKIGVPSWAWASAGSAVSCRYLSSDSDSVKEYVRVEDAWTTTADTDQYGAVTDGELLLGCCNLFLGYLQVESDLEVGSADKAETEAVILNGMDEALPVVLDCLDDLPMRKGEPIYLMPLRGGESGSGISVPVDGNEESADDHDWRDVEIDGRVVEDILVYGIVIKQVNNLKGHFRRIGSFEFKHHAISYPDKCGDGRCYYHEFLALLEKHDMSTAESECMRLSSDAECAEFRYVISIK